MSSNRRRDIVDVTNPPKREPKPTPKAEPEPTNGDGLIITCQEDVKISKKEFLKNPPEKISFRVEGEMPVTCTLLGNEDEFFVYLTAFEGESMWNVVFIFRKKGRMFKRLIDRYKCAEWQMIPINRVRCTPRVQQYRIASEIRHFELFGFEMFSTEDF